MFVARLICSDPVCLYEVEVEATTTAELETLVCDCGWGLAIVAWPDRVDDHAGQVVALRVAPALRHAA